MNEVPNTCGSCTHWHAKPKVPPAGAVMLDVKEPPQRGDCRCMPPSATVQLIQGRGGLRQVTTCVYPDLPEDFLPCGRYWPRVERLPGE